MLASPASLWRRWFGPRPLTCSDAGRIGAQVRHDRERAKIRATTRALALSIGRHDLAERMTEAAQ
jgi:hypothetical protein